MHRSSDTSCKDQTRSKLCVPLVAQHVLKPVQTFHPVTIIRGPETAPQSSDFPIGEDTVSLTDGDTKEHESYPKTELEWLATTVFNRAIDFYLQEVDNLAKKWAEKAFVLAQWIDDGGATRDFLMGRFSKLKFSEV